jgi:hypothetical protein
MTAKERRDPEPTSPKSFAETTPTAFPGSDYSFTLQAVFEMQGRLGRLEQAVETLTDQQKDNNTKIQHMEKVIYAATVIVIFVGPLIGVIISKVWELIFPLLKPH